MSRSSEIIHPSSDLDEDVLIRVNNVSKKFCRDFKKSLWYGLKDTAADILHPTSSSQDTSLRPSEFWANQNISFEVKRGECVGLVGKNGAGKTTLLKMLNGLIKPDTGSIEMHGRVGALIALGAGFNPILTGRENIYVNGSIGGLHKKEIDAKLAEIIDFAEIEDAIDAPVRTYSSGMQVRLGFAVAVILIKPDILIIDEVLAVGDSSFRAKCLNEIQVLLKSAAVIFVSHNENQVKRICTQVLLLSKGAEVLQTHDVSEAFKVYGRLEAVDYGFESGKFTEPLADVISCLILPKIEHDQGLNSTEPINISIEARATAPIGRCRATLFARSSAGEMVAAYQATVGTEDNIIQPGVVFNVYWEIQSLDLASGNYDFCFSLISDIDYQIIFRSERLFATFVSTEAFNGAALTIAAEGKLNTQKTTAYPQLKIYPTSLPLDIIDQVLAVSQDYKYGYFRVAKAANSTVISTLYYMETGISGLTLDTIQPIKDEYWLNCSSLPLNIAELLDSYFKFTFVRNPGDRLISCYLDKVAGRGVKKSMINKALGRNSQDDVSIDVFLDYLSSGGLKSNVHWIPQSLIVQETNDNLDFIGKVENLSDDIQYVVDKIYGKALDKLPSIRDHKTNASEFYTQLSISQRERIAQLYDADFERFGYDKNFWVTASRLNSSGE